MKYYFFAIILLLVCSSAVKGQLSQNQVDSIVLHLVNNLKSNRIDTICVYQNYCIGCLYVRRKGEINCSPRQNYLPTYIIWRNNGTTYLTKRDACFDYPVIKVKDDYIFQYYCNNEREIRQFALKPPAYKEIINGKEITHSEDSDHSLFNEIRFYSNGDTVIKTIKLFYLSKKAGLNADNLNFLYNRNSKLVLLKDQLVKLIEGRAVRKGLTKFSR